VHQRSVVRVGASLIVASLALTACGSRSGNDSGGSSGGSTKTAKIGVIAPLSGDLSALGLGIQHSVELAVKQANDSNAIPGWKLEVEAKDDEAKPDPGKNAATALSSDKDVIGVVGTLNTSVSQQVQPVLAAAKIVQVSPANTGPGLTQGANWQTDPKRPYPTYFRTCTTDAVQGPFAARYLYETAKITKVATIHDKKAYGQGLVGTFTEEFKKLGGTIVAAQTINPDDSNYQAALTAIKPSNPQAIYYGGEYPQAGPLSQQAKAAGLNIPLMGGDGLVNPKYVDLGGRAGDLATNIGAPTTSLPSARQFVADYDAAKYPDPYGAYGPFTYDATNVIIGAVAKAVRGGTWSEDTRTTVERNVQATSTQGAGGPISFDRYGDTTNKVLTVYRVEGSDFRPIEGSTGSYRG
jgi:branched-chain amino acid transport system substrate-binding protein